MKLLFAVMESKGRALVGLERSMCHMLGIRPSLSGVRPTEAEPAAPVFPC